MRTSTLTKSPGTKNIQNIVDGEDPRASNDSTSYFDWWPRNGCPATAPAASSPAAQSEHAAASPRSCSQGEWIEMAFAKAATVSEAQVYWFDDTGRGGVRVPKSWRLLYRDAGGGWQPVDGSEFGVSKDAYNIVRFTPVSTPALRLELIMQPGVSAGVHEWQVK